MEQAPKDKRTRAYKEWVKNHSKASEGLGDTIAKVTEATGIKKAVEWLADGKDCGCDARQAKLNALFKYRKPLCLEEDEFNYLKDTFEKGGTKITPDQQDRMLTIYNRIFNENAKKSGCSPCFVNGVYKKLRTVYDQYK